MPVKKEPSPLSKEIIERQLKRILNSPEFSATKTQRELLVFAVTQALAGRSQEIKAYTIATRVFGRNSNFDANLDPIVSIQANNLRRAIERYYLVAGQNDLVRIDIPKGTFVPTFTEKVVSRNKTTDFTRMRASSGVDDSWPAVVVQPFQNLSKDPEMNYLSIGLATELATELTRYQEIRVLMQGSEGHGRRTSDSGARYAIEGNVRKDTVGVRVAVNLIDASTSTQIWSEMHESDLKAAELFSFQKHVARVVTAKIASETGIIARALFIESKNIPPQEMKTYEALLRYYEFNQNFSEKSFFSAFESLKMATSREPNCGQVWSMLGRLYAVNYGLELFDLKTPLEKALSYAKRGVNLEPANQRNRLILAYVLLLKKELSAGLAETERSLALNPNSLILLELIGYLMTLFGDWKRGPSVIRKAMNFNPYYSTIAHHALWVDWIRQGEYEQAYAETINFNSPALFWEPLMKASVLGLLGKVGEGREALKDLLKLKPDFPIRGLDLIRHYIKFEDIVERISYGLIQTGLQWD